MTVHAYMRISTTDKGQSVENQRIAIKAAGFAVNHWYSEEGVSGSVKGIDRPEFARMMSKVYRGDLVCVTALDRLGRDAEDILNTVNNFEKMGVKVCILALGNTDITSVMGKAFITMLSALAEMERSELRERTKRGLIRVKAEGRILGPKLRIPPNILRELCILREERITLDVLSEKYKLDRNTIAQNVKKYSNSLEAYEVEWNRREAQYKAAEEARIASGKKAA